MTLKTYRIYLNVYNFTSANQYVSCVGLGGYHTGVEINNKEYCYSVISLNSNQSGLIVIEPQTADYQFNRKIYLGQTRLESEQFLQILQRLSLEWTCGKYNVFKNNCNHFSQDFVTRLLGVRIPNWIFRTTNILQWMCFCLPNGLLSGKWAIEALLANREDDYLDYLTDSH